jgi:hypothetical protein
MKMRAERLLASDGHAIAIVARDGCLASIAQAQDETGQYDEMRVRCPRPGRMGTWFDGVDRMLSAVPVSAVATDEDDSKTPSFPVVQVITASGATMRVAKAGDAAKLLREVRSLASELQASEVPAPGPVSASGWQMLRVAGPAHVVFAGEPLNGVLEARVSTDGQYLCQFSSNTDDGPLRATKSGYLPPQHASQAIDEVLKPFEGLGPGERPKATYAVGVQRGVERNASVTSIAAVFERFSSFQDVLGDACLPELEAPAPLGP